MNLPVWLTNFLIPEHYRREAKWIRISDGEVFTLVRRTKERKLLFLELKNAYDESDFRPARPGEGENCAQK